MLDKLWDCGTNSSEMANATQSKVAAFQVRAEAARRGWRIRDLAAVAGLAPDTVTNVLCGNNTSSVTQSKIEAALDKAIWSTPAEFAARKSKQRK